VDDLLVFFAAPVMLVFGLMLALVTDPRIHWRIRARRPAERRGIALLRSWLTPEQARQWEAREEFEVTGCDTGTRYRITRGTMMNIHELDRNGVTVAEWCFAPEGKLAVGDVLLAQKIALETMEHLTLSLANSQACRT
jgi:hypothetical protein